MCLGTFDIQIEFVQEIPIALRLMNYQLKNIIVEYAAHYHSQAVTANAIEQVEVYIDRYAEEINAKVSDISRTMLLASLAEDSVSQNAMQQGFRKANRFVLDGIAGMLTGAISSLELLHVL